MSVQFILDFFHIDCADAVEVKASETDVILQRQRIFEQLRNPSAQIYRVRLTSQMLYDRFVDLENEATVLPTVKLIPRLLLAEKLNAALPDWLTDEKIVALNLLQNAAPEISSPDFEKNLLAHCRPDLILGQNFEKFILALSLQTTAFLDLLEQKSLQKTLLNHLEFDLNITRETAELLFKMLKTCDLATFPSTLAHGQHLYFLRQFVTRYALELALPPLELPPALLSLPRLNLPENAAGALPEKFIATLQNLKAKILANELPANVLAEFLIVDWEMLWRELEELLSANSTLLTQSLTQKIATFESQQAQRLAKKFTQNAYLLLDENASVNDVLAWSEGYFDYLRSAFLYQQPLDETINESFSHYLLSQSARLSRSPANWQHASQKIHQFLEANYLVIVIMVDALSALNQDLLLAELESLTQQEQLILDATQLFAPLPTITEIGKKAVLTGKNAAQFSGDYEKALRETYQAFLPQSASLKIISSYKETSQHVEEFTNLLVYFENRLDERLHECVNFEKHRDDVKLICSQIKTSIRRWAKDALSFGRDMVFFITADHGMTVTQADYLGQQLGEISERFFKLKSAQTPLPPDFIHFENYAIAKKRLRLVPNALLTHGGLTPEEVLIPFVTLTTKTPEPAKTSIEITLKNSQARLISPQNWQVDLCLTANKTVSDIRVEANGIFQGKTSIDSLRANKTQELIFTFSANNQQEGRTEMELTIFYCDLNLKSSEKILKIIAVDFLPSLIEKDSSAQSFEDMF